MSGGFLALLGTAFVARSDMDTRSLTASYGYRQNEAHLTPNGSNHVTIDHTIHCFDVLDFPYCDSEG